MCNGRGRRDCHKRGTTRLHGARQPNGFPLEHPAATGKHDQREATTAKQLFGTDQCLRLTVRPQQQYVPAPRLGHEKTLRIDPRRTLAARDNLPARSTQHGRRSRARSPERDPSARQSTPRKHRIQRTQSGRDRAGRSLYDRLRVGKSLPQRLSQGKDFGGLHHHLRGVGPKPTPNKTRKQAPDRSFPGACRVSTAQ